LKAVSCTTRLLVLLCLAVGLRPVAALADGGTVLAMEQGGTLAISVFTSPPWLNAGEVDISVLVQDAKSNSALVEAQVQITVTPRQHPNLAERHEATDELATNRLMKVCHVKLEPGWHDVEVLVEDRDRSGRLQFAILVGKTPTKAASFWPWFTWPAVPIILVAANLAYRRLQTRRSAIIDRSTASSVRTLP
jgi:hypothetical protein